jgi:hypothetical protein
VIHLCVACICESPNNDKIFLKNFSNDMDHITDFPSPYTRCGTSLEFLVPRRDSWVPSIPLVSIPLLSFSSIFTIREISWGMLPPLI